MPKEDPILVEGLRSAIEDLTATVSDFEGDSVELATERSHAYLVGLDSRGAAVGAEIGRISNGYRQLSLKLVIELAKAREVSPQSVMRGIGTWTTRME